MATLDELWRGAFPAARPASRNDPAALARPVAWVRVLKARVPAFDALEPGDLALVPETALAALGGSVEPAALVEAIAHAEAAGIVLLGEGGSEAVSAATLAAAGDAGLPAFRLAGADPKALERSVIGFLVNARAELERQAATLESRLEQLALESADLAAHAAAIADFLARGVAIEDARGTTLAVHAPEGLEAAAADAARYLARPQGSAQRVPLPGGGALALLGTPPVSELERTVATRVAGLLALELGRQRAGRNAVEGRGEAVPSDGPPWVVLVTRQVMPGAAVGAEDRRAVRDRVRALAPARRLALRGDADSLELRLVAAPEPHDPEGLGLAGRIATSLGRPVVVSRPFDRPEGRPLAEQEARATLEVVEALGPGESAATGGATVARSDRLPAYRLLGNLHNLPDGPRHARALLAPLLDQGRPAARGERLATLRAVLEAPGLTEAAAALGIHRNTLAYRLQRIEAATGWRVDDPELRFALALAVRLVQSDQRQDI